MLYLKFLFNFSLHLTLIRAGFVQDKLFDGVVMHVDRIDAQCRGRNVAMKSLLQGVKTVSTKVLIENCTMVAKEGGFKKIMMTITINKCQFKENLDTCEEYLKQGNIDFCKAIDPDNPIISSSPFYVPFDPPLKCPINKGVYRGHNISFDLAPFIFFKLEGWYWRIKSELVSDQNRLVYCLFLDGFVTNSKSKRN